MAEREIRMETRLYVGNLSYSSTEGDLEDLFKQAGTGLEPFDAATVLVTTGFYRVTRNPMYLGMFLMLLGVAFLMGSIGALLPVSIFILIIRNNFVLGEERFMQATFGQQYLQYKSEVRRWF